MTVSWECNLKESPPSDTGHFLSPPPLHTQMDSAEGQRGSSVSIQSHGDNGRGSVKRSRLRRRLRGVAGTRGEKPPPPSLRRVASVSSQAEALQIKGLSAGFSHSKCVCDYRREKRFKTNSTFFFSVVDPHEMVCFSLDWVCFRLGLVY